MIPEKALLYARAWETVAIEARAAGRLLEARFAEKRAMQIKFARDLGRFAT